MASNSIVGVDLNIDHDFLSDVVRQVALNSIAEAMNKENHIVEAIVKQVMRQKVDPRTGEQSRYSSKDDVTLLEFYVRRMLTEEVRGQVVALVEERRPEVAEAVRRELERAATVESFTNAFIRSLTSALDNKWNPCVEISFKEQEKEGEGF